MSWDTFEYDEFSNCACGKGKVIRHMQQRDDDWNRVETSCLGEEIECTECKEKFYIQHIIRWHLCPSWDGDGIYDRVFLVPNDIEMPSVKTKKVFSFSSIDKQIASEVSLSEISESIQDMINSKYTTKLQLGCSRHIVDLFFKRYKKKSLKLIIPVLQHIVQNYADYEWTPETVKEYRKREEEDIKLNEDKIEKAIKASYELDFRR